MEKIQARRCVVLPNEGNNIEFCEVTEIEVTKGKYKKGDRLESKDEPSVKPNQYFIVL